MQTKPAPITVSQLYPLLKAKGVYPKLPEVLVREIRTQFGQRDFLVGHGFGPAAAGK